MGRRARWTAVVALILVAPLLALGCAQLKKAGGATARAVKKPVEWIRGPGMPPPEAEAVLAYITEAEPYGKFRYWPGRVGMYKGQHPHGAWLTLSVNDKAMGALKEGEKVFPPGSIIAKENYTPEEKLAALTIMYKVKDYDPEHNDWFWAKYNYEGGKFAVDKAGKVPGCIDCHGAVKNLDYVFNLKQK